MAVRVLRSILDVSAADWNALDLHGQPFLRHEFLAALEHTGCAIAGTGWVPQHLLLLDDSGRLLGAVPLYLKAHSYGEFVFDFSWAQSFDRYFHQAGLRYYPKLTAAVPFTPATGPRLLTVERASANIRQALLAALESLCGELQVSSAHVLFAEPEEYRTLIEQDWLPRTSCQFHWFNRNYVDMDDFLATFRADKRKKAKRERRRVLEEYGIRYRTFNGAELDAKQWRTVFSFSQNTFHQHGHEHYLSAAFFQQVAHTMPDQIMVKLAEHQGQPVAAAIFFRSHDTLFGRYWGAEYTGGSSYDSLHFETCYYQGIEYCIENGLRLFEPGTQGEHKIARGFEPTLSYSGHYIAEPRFRAALADHLTLEREAVDDYLNRMREHIPFHRDAHSPTHE